MDMSQLCVDKMHQQEIVMNNNERNIQFGLILSKSFWAQCNSRFEYVTIIVEKGSTVCRHLDYLNSQDINYNVECSYSYLIKKDNEIYHINCVLCNCVKVVMKEPSN